MTTLSATTLDVGEASRPEPLPDQVSLVLRWPQGVRVVLLEPGRPVTLGRSGESELVIAERTLSRRHAKLWCVGTQVHVEDCGSRNGVWLRGQRVQHAALKPGEWLALGEVVVSVHLAGGENPTLGSRPSAVPRESSLYWEGEGMAALQLSLARASKSTLPVLILGETGTGKELIAQEIHRRSARAARPMQIVNCAALPSALVGARCSHGAARSPARSRPCRRLRAGRRSTGSWTNRRAPGRGAGDALAVLDTGAQPLGSSPRPRSTCASWPRPIAISTRWGERASAICSRLDVISWHAALRERPSHHACSPLLGRRRRSAPKHFSEEALIALEAYDGRATPRAAQPR